MNSNRLVELLADPDEHPTTRRSRISRSGTARSSFAPARMAAIAAGRPPPPGLDGDRREVASSAAEWGERQLLLRALAGSDGKVIPAVLAAAEEDWSGQPARAGGLAASWTRVSQPGESWTVAELETLDASLQPLVRELIDQADDRDEGCTLGPRSSSGSRRVDRRRLLPRARACPRSRARGHRRRSSARADRGGRCARRRPLAASRPRSRPARRRAGRRQDDADRRGASTARATTLVRVPGRRHRGRTPARRTSGCSRRGVQEIVGHVSQRARSSGSSRAFEEALWSGQHTQSPRGLLDALLPHVEAGDAVVVGEIDPLAYELLIQNRPAGLARLFEVDSARAAWRTTDALEVARGLGRATTTSTSTTTTLAEALDLAPTICRRRPRPATSYVCSSSSRDRVARGAATAIDPETVIATLSAATGLPLHVLDPRAPLEPRSRCARSSKAACSVSRRRSSASSSGSRW